VIWNKLKSAGCRKRRLASIRRCHTLFPLPRHIHLSGICGTAMASLAGLLQLRGHRITGSDKAAYPPMSDQLRAWAFRSDGTLRGNES
jgi:hypothetical protein